MKTILESRKIDESQKNRNHRSVGILWLCMLVFSGTTTAMHSQEAKNGNEINIPELIKDWNKQDTRGIVLHSPDKVPFYYQHIWYRASILLGESIAKYTGVVIHSLHEDTTPPYAVVICKKKSTASIPFIISIPKELFVDESWERAKSYTKYDFATRWNYEIPGPPTMRLPITRTLSSNDGRQIEGTVLATSDTSIRFRRADNQDVTIPLTALSEADQKWIGQTSNRVLRILAITQLNSRNSIILEFLKLGYEVHVTNQLEQMTRQELDRFDMIFYTPTTESQLPTETQQFAGIIMKYEPIPEKFKREKRKDDRWVIANGKNITYRYMNHEAPPQDSIKAAVDAAIKFVGNN